MTKHRALHARTTLCLTVAWLAVSACHSWRPLNDVPPSPTELKDVHHVRVRLTDGSQVELRGTIRAEGDSLVAVSPTARRAVAFDQISSIEERKSQPVATGLLVATGALLVLGAIAVATYDLDLSGLDLSGLDMSGM